jgi:hypothetical protein
MAGVEAAQFASRNMRGIPDAILVFASPEYDHDALLLGVTSIVGEVPMAGGTTAGEIWHKGFSKDSVVVLALQSDVLRFVTAVSEGMLENEYECGRNFVKNVNERCNTGTALALIVFPDGMGGDGNRVIDGVQSGIRKNIDIVGGFLGDNERFSHTFQYYDGKVYQNAITGLMIATSPSARIRTGVGAGSGFTSIGNSMKCTLSNGSVVKEIDHEPALDLYMELLGEKRSKRLPTICLEYPFGLINARQGSLHGSGFLLRFGISVDYNERSITMAGSVPQGSAMTLTMATRGDIINGARQAAEQAKDRLKGYKPELIIVFSCVGRKIILGRRVNDEIKAVKEILGEDTPIIGFYTYGEIGPAEDQVSDRSTICFHNENMVIWAIGSAG